MLTGRCAIAHRGARRWGHAAPTMSHSASRQRRLSRRLFARASRAAISAAVGVVGVAMPTSARLVRVRLRRKWASARRARRWRRPPLSLGPLWRPRLHRLLTARTLRAATSAAVNVAGVQIKTDVRRVVERLHRKAVSVLGAEAHSGPASTSNPLPQLQWQHRAQASRAVISAVACAVGLGTETCARPARERQRPRLDWALDVQRHRRPQSTTRVGAHAHPTIQTVPRKNAPDSPQNASIPHFILDITNFLVGWTWRV